MSVMGLAPLAPSGRELLPDHLWRRETQRGEIAVEPLRFVCGRHAGAWAGVSRASTPRVSVSSQSPRLRIKPLERSDADLLPSMGGNSLGLHSRSPSRPRSQGAPRQNSMYAQDAMRELATRKKMVMQMLDEWDTTGDGKIDLDEMQRLLRGLGLASGHEAWDLAKELFKTLDDDQSGKVDRHELFRDMATGSKQPVSPVGFVTRKQAFENQIELEEHRRQMILNRKERLGNKAERNMTTAYGKGGNHFVMRRQSPSRSPPHSPSVAAEPAE